MDCASERVLVWAGVDGDELAGEDVVSAVAFCKTRREWCSGGGDGNVVVWGMGI